LSGAQPGDFSHLPHAPGLRLHFFLFFYWGLIPLIVVIQSNLRVYTDFKLFTYLLGN
jgi:hypothetical protein